MVFYEGQIARLQAASRVFRPTWQDIDVAQFNDSLQLLDANWRVRDLFTCQVSQGREPDPSPHRTQSYSQS